MSCARASERVLNIACVVEVQCATGSKLMARIEMTPALDW
jgi:hypothetical protein